MVKKRITFILPDANFGYTHCKVYRSTDNKVTQAELSPSDDAHYVAATGIPIPTYSYCVDVNSADTYWYYIQFYDSGTGKLSDPSDWMQAMSIRGYCTVEEVRDYTNVQSAEYSDAAVQMLIDTITMFIDHETGRTWQGVQTVTDERYYGDGLPSLILNRNDIQSIASLSIDQTNSNVWTTVSTSDYYWQAQGVIHIYPSPTSIQYALFPNSFPTRNMNVKVSYTWGNASPGADVKMLCLLQVANMMKMDFTRLKLITDLKAYLRHQVMASP